MADQQHLDILKQGVETWNQWRKAQPYLLNEIDLRGASFHKTELRGANLSYADLSGADFSGADLTWANLNKSDFSGANLSQVNLTLSMLIEANLTAAILHKADLTLANLRGIILVNADLSNSNLDRANLINADLRGADFTDTQIGNTAFDNVNLIGVKGLETVYHFSPSSIGIDTIIHSQGTIPEAFLRGAGVPDTFITNMRALVDSMSPIDFYSCFISYSSKDQAFAERLYSDLQSKGVRCWFAPKDMDIGDKIRHRIEESIRLYDKLLLILSEDSIASNWVAYEVEKALDKEPKGIPNVLYPVRLDDRILTCTTDWATNIKSTRHIGDFTHWKNHDDYQKTFNRLLRALKAGTQKREP